LGWVLVKALSEGAWFSGGRQEEEGSNWVLTWEENNSYRRNEFSIRKNFSIPATDEDSNTTGGELGKESLKRTGTMGPAAKRTFRRVNYPLKRGVQEQFRETAKDVGTGGTQTSLGASKLTGPKKTTNLFRDTGIGN